MKKLLILLSMFMSISANAYTVDSSVEEKISDCKVDFENQVVVESFSKVRNCLVEKRVNSKSFHVHQENRLENANADLLNHIQNSLKQYFYTHLLSDSCVCFSNKD